MSIDRSRPTVAGQAAVPTGVRTLSDLSVGLERLRSAAGISYRELQRQVAQLRQDRGAQPVAYETVYRCLQAGRRRLDVDLVADIATALTGDPAGGTAWRRAYESVVDQLSDERIVEVVPQLPAVRTTFVGRQDERSRLRRSADNGPAVHLIDGMPGAGKSWLAGQAAQDAAQELQPDFVAFVDLRGYDAVRPPADPGAVLGELLRLLSVPVAQLAGLDTQARSTLFREKLADRRAVLVLDDAAGDDQVLPLLPGTPESIVFVTSRVRMERIVGTRQTIGVLPAKDSVEVLRRLIGRENDNTDDSDDLGVLDRLAEAAAHLPLALALVGSRARDRPDWTLADQVDRLVESARVLRIEKGVEFALDLSYQALDQPARAMLRALSLHPNRRIDTGAAAALAELPIDRAAACLDALLAANLVSSGTEDRVEVHDLVRIFATGRALDEDPPLQRAEAAFRLATYYTATAAHAMDVWKPGAMELWKPGGQVSVASDGVAVASFTTPAQALAWLDAERSAMVALALGDQPCASGPTALTLAEVLNQYFRIRGHYREAEIMYARGARQATGARRGRLLMRLAGIRGSLGLYEQAIADAREAEQIGRSANDVSLEAGALTNLGMIARSRSRWAEANRRYLRALSIVDGTDDLYLRVLVRTNLGGLRRRQGRPDEAITWFQQAQALADSIEHNEHQALGARAGIADALEDLGRTDEALEHASQVLVESRANGLVFIEVEALAQIARITSRSGSPREALELHLTALRLARDNQHQRDIITDLERDLAETRERLGRDDTAR
ncbi:tetratricopeptide repeat protein [Kribbella sp. CA-293567]|uniref:tetratricopeptide repeat protein n=1 Tax=Kribbella sp. CA-293567 TaxID=3002436 RepID=UPI0022DE3451|nr:tetratricopeptide repeat protein [Kribbella sp. CA-293567]WBQ03318.1 tetratricopeptide repeat protein [Kribbella sp. CA-293567]